MKNKLSQVKYTASKVPEITAMFWVTKILTTGMGEVASDYFTKRFEPVLAVLAALIALTIALTFQFSRRRYVPWVYWLNVVMVSIFGTMAADALHLVGIPYIVTTIVYILALAAIFGFWQYKEGSISIHSIHTRRRELFYWATVLATFALGTAAGDMTAATFHLGYFTSGIIFAVAILIPAIARWKFKLNEVLTFWLAYVLTRPLGASFADWMGVSKLRGGLGIGTGLVSLVMTLLIIACVSYLAYTHEDVEQLPT